MLEAVSIHTLTARPMFAWGDNGEGAWLLTRTWWTREHEVGLALLARHKINIEKAADSLGRQPTSLVHRALDTGLKIPKAWRDLVTKRRLATPPRVELQYPYISEVRGEHADLLAVNALVPRGMPDHMRADVCQEIMLAIWQKEISLDELKKAPTLVRKYLSRARTMNYEGGGFALSLDVPMRDGRSWYDVLPDPTTEEYQ